VVEISPLGLVEMTRQNVTDGPREILTKKCPTCGGDGIVVSEATAAVEAERRLRALAAGSKAKAFRIELPARVATHHTIGLNQRRLDYEAIADHVTAESIAAGPDTIWRYADLLPVEAEAPVDLGAARAFPEVAIAAAAFAESEAAGCAQRRERQLQARAVDADLHPHTA